MEIHFSHRIIFFLKEVRKKLRNNNINKYSKILNHYLKGKK